MRKTVILNSDETVTFFLLAKLNHEILLCGLTKENTEDLIELQFQLTNIVRKVRKFSK